MRLDRLAVGTVPVVSTAGLAAGLTAALIAGLAGCTPSPLEGTREQSLRRYVTESARAEIADAALKPQLRVTNRTSDPLPIDPKFFPELETIAGPASRNMADRDYGTDLTGAPTRAVGITLRHAIRSAVDNNLEVQFARLAPAITETDVIAAEGAFDWVFFSNTTWNDLDQVGPASSFRPNGGITLQESIQNTTGLRRPLESGGQFSIQQELIYTDFNTPGFSFTPDPAAQAALTIQFDQPLLRNFGSDVALAQIRVNRNLERNAVAQLRAQLILTVNQVESTYWELVRAQHDLVILERLLERGIGTRDQLQVRLESGLDVPPSQLADAVARVERRKADVATARDVVRDASDQLKLLMNDTDTPVGSEILLEPIDLPVDEPIEFSLVDVLMTAVRHRPEVDQAILSIDNTSIREVVAANLRMPQLNLQVQARFQGIDNGLNALREQTNGDFIDYVVALTFEQPIGNRAAEAGYVRRRIEREQAVLSYRNTLQQVVRDVKSSLRSVIRNYQLIEQRRNSRIAAAESLRTLEVENMEIRERSSERLELEFNRQESLSNAERLEMQTITDFNTAVAQLYASMGTALERNNIVFVAPDAKDALLPRYSTDYWASWGQNNETETMLDTPPDANNSSLDGMGIGAIGEPVDAPAEKSENENDLPDTENDIATPDDITDPGDG
ncbi:MAG: TolC family protein [Planctomycetota bacterium]|nr:TolC family protein [Planctomycetota bacterium]